MRNRLIFGLLLAAALPLWAAAETLPKVALVGSDPLEMASGQIPQEVTSESRTAMLQLLARARASYSLRSVRTAYDLKVSFTVDSANPAGYEGEWQMEDLFVPGQGLRWTAQNGTRYAITGIATQGKQYRDGTPGNVPLRLLEARGVLLHPLPSADFASRQSIRVATGAFEDGPLTCVLLSSSGKAGLPASGRGWEESEECIDPQSGLLRIHSEAPGRYVVYDYVHAVHLGGHTLPGTVTVNEAGRAVSRIRVEKLEQTSGIDASLFVPTEAMKARGSPVEMGAMTRISRVRQQGAMTPEATVRPVCITGIVTSAGRLAEAHSLQPSDPNSQAALADASLIHFSKAKQAGVSQAEHFVVVIEKFVSPQ